MSTGVPAATSCGAAPAVSAGRRIARHLELGVVGGGALGLLNAAVEREREDAAGGRDRQPQRQCTANEVRRHHEPLSICSRKRHTRA